MSIHQTISQENLKHFYKSHNLPHLFDVDKPIFITYRLKFTLPRKTMLEYEERKKAWLEKLETVPEIERLIALKSKDGLFFAWFDDLLEQAEGIPKILHSSEITDIIANTFKHFDGLRYKLIAYCIMPNHIHILIMPLKDEQGIIFSPAHITYSWKRFSTNMINRLLDKAGSLWQKESYDRMVRDERELINTVNYILYNPVKAGLVEDWKSWRGSFLCVELS